MEIKVDEEGNEYGLIDLEKLEPIGPGEHECIYEEEPDPDYPGRVYLTCKLCHRGVIVNK